MRSTGIVTALLCFPLVLAAADSNENGKFSMAGKLEFEAAEMMKARMSPPSGQNPGSSMTVDHIWYGHTIATINLASSFSDRFSVHTSFEFRQYMTMLPMTLGSNDPFFGNTYWNGFYVRECQGIFSLLKKESKGTKGTLSLELALGLMPYKYNQDVQDLGEFLFRSGTYPLYLLGELNRPYARLTGLRLGAKAGDDTFGWTFDWLVLTERELRPFNDISLAALLNVNFFKILGIGGGVDFARAIPVNSHVTTPQVNDNRYVVKYAVPAGDSAVDSIINSAYYTFKGTKITARATIDFFGALRNCESGLNEFLGENGGKVYGEFAVIGLENYPAAVSSFYNPRGFTKVSERSPWMAGITIPAWKILDLCALEFERFPGYLPDSYWRPVINGYPQSAPRGSITGDYDSSKYVPRWNWSLSMKKQIVRHFGIAGQIGRNHQRWEFNPNQSSFYDFETVFMRPDQWGWHLSGVFSF